MKDPQDAKSLIIDWSTQDFPKTFYILQRRGAVKTAPARVWVL